MTGSNDGVVVVGGSAAGLTTVQSLRREGFDGPVTVVSDEYGLPYDRPPLSKEVASGTWDPKKVRLTSQLDLDSLDVTWLSGTRAVSANLANRRVGLGDGMDLPYDALVIATGLRARRPATLVPSGVRGVHVLRTLDDALTLRDELAVATSVAIVGAGFVGAELASTARALGVQVTLIDPMPHPLGGVAAGPMATYISRLHRDNDVDLRCGVGVSGLMVENGAVSALALDDLTSVNASLVVVALGSQPSVDWLEGNDLDLSDGVACAATLLAAPGVYAVGDVARPFRIEAGRRVRIEHRLNATEQGLHVGEAIARGEQAVFSSLPYFWSDQFGVRLQGYGIARSTDDVAVIHGDPDEGRFVLAHGRDGHVVAITGVGMPREVRLSRTWISESRPWADALAESLLTA